MSAVQLSELSLEYDRGPILSGINLAVESGQYVVVLGASGCGKTSLLRVIAGLIMPSSGKVLFSGNDVRTVPPRLRDVALVPQHSGLYPHMTIGKAIAVGIRDKLSKDERQRRVTEAAKCVEMDAFLDRLPEQLSGGQLRRASVAKAIASQASVRLLDEPLSAIDAELRFQIERDLRRLHEQSPGVTIHVTHDGDEAIRLADRIVVIEQGGIAQIDSPEKLRLSPASPGVASAIGRSQLMTVTVCRGQDSWVAPNGQTIIGGQAIEEATATIGYYQADALPLVEAPEVEPGDWVDQANGVFVRRRHVIWFGN